MQVFSLKIYNVLLTRNPIHPLEMDRISCHSRLTNYLSSLDGVATN